MEQRIWHSMTAAFLFIFGLSLGTTAEAGLRRGDLIFASMNCYACKLIESTTSSPFSHVGVINFKVLNSGSRPQWTVIMAVEPRVVEVPLEAFLSGLLGPRKFMRLKGDLPDSARGAAARAAAAAESYVGVPYDSDYLPGAAKLYCAELIYFAFRDALGWRSPFILEPMDFNPYTVEWTAVLGHAPPQGLPGINPGQIAKSSALIEIFP